jgi:hypothetical protein
MEELKREGIKGPQIDYTDNTEQLLVLLARANLPSFRVHVFSSTIVHGSGCCVSGHGT